MQAGNTHQTLASTPVEVAAIPADVVTPVTVDTPEVEPQGLDVQKTLLEVLKEEAAIKASRRVPQPSATQPPTSTAPIEYVSPARGPKSYTGPAPVPYTGQGKPAVEQTVATAPATSKFVSRAEFEALEARIAVFNSRSSQKI